MAYHNNIYTEIVMPVKYKIYANVISATSRIVFAFIPQLIE